jgi:hypothetical protein
MTKPTGKLKFAYETISNMDASIEQLTKERNELVEVFTALEIYCTPYGGYDSDASAPKFKAALDVLAKHKEGQ